MKLIGESKNETTSEDTQIVAKAIVESGVDLLVFCGGDGTTRDILKAVGLEGSCVWGFQQALKCIAPYLRLLRKLPQELHEFSLGGLPLREAEVMDVDEQAFRARTSVG